MGDTGWGKARAKLENFLANEITHIVVLQTDIVDHAAAEADEAGTANHGGALEPWSVEHSRDSGGVSREGPPRVFDRTDHRLSPGRKEGAEAREEDQQCTYLRSCDLPQRRTGQIDR